MPRSRVLALSSFALLTLLLLQEPLQRSALAVVRFPFGVVKGTVKTLVRLPRLASWSEERERLRAELLQRQLEVAQLREVMRQSATAQRLVTAHALPEGVVATVIDRSRIPTQQTVLLDKGQRHGLTLGGVVVDADGVAGRILELFPSTALVLLVTDAESRVAGLVERSRETGLLVGRGHGSCELIYLDLEADVEAGDRVVTAGLGGASPKGLLLGVISRVIKDEARGTAWAVVRPAAHLGRLEEVLCLPGSEESLF